MASIIKLLGVIQDVCVEEYIVNFFKELRVQDMAVYGLDPTLAKFNQLKVLNLSFNNITKIEFLPPNLEELYMNGNEVNEVALNPTKPFHSMIHLGLSMNKIRQPALTVIVKVFPNLFCLDASFNDLCDMEAAMGWICKLKKIKMLYLEGNPLVFTNNYSKIIAERVHGLKMLDGHAIFLDQETINAQEAAKKG